jgi:predicted PurR-regulated permease PerM
MLDFPVPLDRRPVHVAPVESPGLRSLLTVAVAFVVLAGLYFGRSVLIPLTLAVLLSFLLTPLVNLLRRGHLGRVPSVVLAILAALTVILSVGGLIGTQVAGLAEDVPRYVSTIQQKVDTVQRAVLSRIATLTGSLVHQPARSEVAAGTKPGAFPTGKSPPGVSPVGTSPTGASAAAAPSADASKPISVEVHQPDQTVIQLVQRIVTPVVEPLSTTAIVFIVAIFILLQREDLRDRMIRLFGSSDLHRTTVAMNDAARRLSRYLLTQLVVNAAFGVIIATGLAFIGIPSPVIWGVLGALLRFVPYIGAPLSAVIPLALAAAVDPGWSALLWTACLYRVVEATMGKLVEPLLYGRSTGLSPFAVVVAATFWTWLWGPIGLIVSTPLTLCLVVLGRHVARLQFLDVLLGDRPALTPVESFYQRILAGDPDEAHDQAEVLLKERPLWSYYDEVALQGLRLAVIDAERGALTPAHLERIKVSVQSLIEDLDDHKDGEPSRDAADVATTIRPYAQQAAPKHPVADGAAPNGLDPASVLCIAGRGMLDEAISTMLAQLLEKRGIATRVVEHAATTRGAIGSLDVGGVTMVCISCLDLSGSPSHLRYLLRRLRRHLPSDVPVLIGVWPGGEAILADERLRAAVGADYHTTSLHDAVEACLGVACRAQGYEPPLSETTPVAATP